MMILIFFLDVSKSKNAINDTLSVHGTKLCLSQAVPTIVLYVVLLFRLSIHCSTVTVLFITDFATDGNEYRWHVMLLKNLGVHSNFGLPIEKLSKNFLEKCRSTVLSFCVLGYQHISKDLPQNIRIIGILLKFCL